VKSASVSVRGLSCQIPKGILDSELTAFDESKEKVYGRKRKGGFQTVRTDEPVFSRNGNYIYCGIGAILFLSKNNPFVSIEFDSIVPERSTLSRIEVPELLLESPKWKVNGKERFYFHESLEACRKNHCGTIKLPTGSGKTLIELTLGYNQVREIGTGIILVPTNTIKDQFIREANRYKIDLRDYRKWLYDLEYEESSMIISLPGVLCNDILNLDKHDPQVKSKLKNIKWIIGDEVHHAGCETWNGIFMGLPNLGRSHGFSALPVTKDSSASVSFSRVILEDALTIATAGPVIYAKSTKELKDFLNIPSLINFKYTWPKDKYTSTADWHKLRSFCKTNKERINLIGKILLELVNREYHTICHVDEKEYGELILEATERDPKIVCWYGSGKVIGSDINIKELRRQAGSRILGIICTQHGIEGLDLDSPLNALLLVGGQKPRQILQKCGRIVRPDEKPSVIVNLMDEGLWILPRHSKIRKDWIQSEFDSDVHNISSLEELQKSLDMMERKP
jgi:superfamily II DNA or RNA helicase